MVHHQGLLSAQPAPACQSWPAFQERRYSFPDFPFRFPSTTTWQLRLMGDHGIREIPETVISDAPHGLTGSDPAPRTGMEKTCRRNRFLQLA